MSSRWVAPLVALILVVALSVSPVTARDGDGSAAAQIALAHLDAQFSETDLRGVTVTDEYTSPHNAVTHVYLRQTYDGLPVLGAEATVNVQRGVVVHSGQRFISELDTNASGQQVVDARQAVALAAAATDADSEEPDDGPTLVYRAVGDGSARLAWDVQFDLSAHWWHVSVDAETGEVIYQADLVDHHDAAQLVAGTARAEHAHVLQAAAAPSVLPAQQVTDGSSYNVYALPLESPLDGPRSIVRNPADAAASPFGWHDTDGIAGAEFTVTRGNNVNAYADTADRNSPDPHGQPDGGSSLTFDYPIARFDATPALYREAAVTNLFYWNNLMHDVTYRYGFDEAAGNFQDTNYSGRGKGGDAVLAEAQDGGGALNASFATPEDGSPGRMQMYLWADVFQTLGLGVDDVVRSYSHEVRDGDLDGGVIAHEYGHGVSNRLVGGPSNVSCLRTHDERQGEGWSDWWSYVMTMRPGDDGATPRGIANYLTYDDEGRSGTGVRPTPYSTDMNINPTTYHSIRSAAEPHGVGYVWASMLWDLYWNLVEEHGFNPNVYEPWDTGGNNLAIQLVVDSMKFSPCTPGFVDARNAIIAADAALTGDVANGVPGQNQCLIWATFARRGLGFTARQNSPNYKTDGVQRFDVPPHCTTP